MDDPARPQEGDGQCTGFPEAVGPWNWHECCVVHDNWGTDGQLLDCITAEVQEAGWIGAVLVIAALLVMKIFQPVYDWLRRHGLVR